MTPSPVALAGAVQHVLRHTTDRVVPLVTSSQVFWVKRAAPARLGIGHRIQRALAAVLRVRLIGFTAVTDGAGSLAREAGIIRVLARKGARVPEVVLQAADYLVLSDLGPSLEMQLRRALSRETATELAVAGAVALRRLHLSGGWHGFPLARNIAGPPAALGFLDFEEDPGRQMSPAQCRMRDFLLYLQSLGGFNARHPGLTRAAADAYLAAAPLTPMQARNLRWLRWMLHAASPAAWLLWPFRRVLGRDLRDALIVWRELRSARMGPGRVSVGRRRTAGGRGTGCVRPGAPDTCPR